MIFSDQVGRDDPAMPNSPPQNIHSNICHALGIASNDLDDAAVIRPKHIIVLPLLILYAVLYGLGEIIRFFYNRKRARVAKLRQKAGYNFMCTWHIDADGNITQVRRRVPTGENSRDSIT